MKKFFEFKNITPISADLFIYGEIVTEKSIDWWTGEESTNEVGLLEFKENLDKLGNIKSLNMYINSPGGDVFAASTMISMLERLKNNGTTINAYIDGLSASAASFLMMVADNINVYKNSIVMVHKPMSFAMGNANDMKKTIDALDTIENNVMIPMYMNKAKASEEEIKSLIDRETWLSAKEMDEYFNVNLLDEEKVAVANIKSNLFKNYKHVPEEKQNIEEEKEHFQKEDAFFDEKNKEKEQLIQAKLGLIKNSLIIEKRKGEMINE